MAIDFPTSPTPNQVYTLGSRSWTWNNSVGAWYAVNAGVQGIQGIQGAQGVQGTQGTQGEQGIQGIQGIQGVQGVTGLAFTVAKTYVSVAALTADTSPSAIVAGQFALINTSDVEDPDNSKLYLWDGSAYSFINDLSGTAGIQGVTGSQGIQGIQGLQGVQGIQGTQGTQGIQGISGASILGLNNTFTGVNSININGTVGATTPTTGVFSALTVNDDTTLGSSNSDTVDFKARVASDINPATDNTYDLGVTGHEWRNLHIDGTANIDSLVADTADINGGTIDGTAIGATTPSTGAFTTVSATGAATITGAVNSANAFVSTGPVTANGADRVTLDFGNGTTGRVLAWGPNNSTAGQLDLGVLSANATVGGTSIARVSATGLAVTGALSSTTGASFATSSGSVGVGTASPASKLHVASTSPAILTVETTGDGAALVSYKNGAGRKSWQAGCDMTAVNTFEIRNVTDSTTVMAIQGAGNVGIGTTSPASKLHVSGSGADIRLTDTEVANATWRILAQTGNNTKLFRIFDESNAADRLVINSSGNVGISQTSPASVANYVYLHIGKGSTSVLQHAAIRLQSGNGSGGARTWDTFVDGSGAYWQTSDTGQNGGVTYGIRCQYAGGGSGTAGAFHPTTDNLQRLGLSGNRWTDVYATNGTIQTSDERDKTDIIESPLGLNFIKSLSPKAFRWKDGSRTHTGFISQQVSTVIPEGLDWAGFIIGDIDDSDSRQGLRYSELIAPMVKAIQEQQALIQSLTERLAALESK